MEPEPPSLSEPACGASRPPVEGLRVSLPTPTGLFQVAEKMERRTCALCPKDLEYSVLYFAQSGNIAAHENCLLYSSALVECEDHESHNGDRSFDVESVKKEIYRGRKLTCRFCRQKGATVGCEVKSCSKSYHFFCAKSDHAVLQTDGSRGIYKVFCQQHAPKGGFQNDNFSGVKRKKMKKCLSTDICVQTPAEMTVNRFLKQLRKMDGTHTDAVMKVSFLKKCKEAGLLNDLFEAILDKLHSIHERLMDETASESDYEEIGTSLFDCTLFEDTFFDFQAAIENEIHQSEERRRQLKEEIELLQDLKQTLCSVQRNRDTAVTSESSYKFPKPESQAQLQAGREDTHSNQ
ncbi:histone-lysine N-methyltransferase SETDB2 isoform X4 [Talpa occidentalis]|uniref:histone-lysine N-methyltransferase SETDB2 isoform X4 n=1 Tax=Talpa occidentalis TaxID=50954 RepID=UPI001890A981|nr:histone-lysine N-methyltransferase SETDB2 isoform X4 [Talpa occidentalis]